ncbi:MAG: hypothetical protein BRC25_00055 [Parcubacteria group bacterium SW_6_46_9]|nr:MAG: hypothetical protein BRC25_00055 [Parcubacteria group bacterium SW_6_46_9]
MSDSIEPVGVRNMVEFKEFQSVSELVKLLKKASKSYGAIAQLEIAEFSRALSDLVLDGNKSLSNSSKAALSRISLNLLIKAPYDDAHCKKDSVIISRKEASKAARLVNQHMIWHWKWTRLGIGPRLGLLFLGLRR